MNLQITLTNSPRLVISFLIGLLILNFNTVYSQTGDCKTADFNLANEFATGPDAFTLASADINGDGIIDVITPNIDAQIVSVSYGDGAGGFAPPRSVPTGAAVRTVTVGDLNADGKPDLIGASYFGSSKIVVLINNGQSGFSAPATIALPSNFSQFYNLKVADLNGDGKADLAGVTETSLHLFLGNGQGGFLHQTTLAWTGNQSEIVTGNFNADNIADLALTSGKFGTPWEFGVVLGRADGTFVFNNRFSLDNQPSSFVVGKFNGDNLMDIAVAANYPYQNSTPPTYFLQPWFGNGAGGFTAGAKVFLPFTVYGLAAGDFNNDGKPDLAASLGSLTATVNGNGDGTFHNKLFYATPPSDRLLSADVNRDGKDDLLSVRGAYPTSYLSVLLSNGAEFSAPKSIVYGGTDLVAADFNNDNLLDLVTGSDSDFPTPSQIVTALNDGNRGFLPDRAFNTAIALEDLAVGDFNGDGKKDVVTAHANNGRLYAVYLGDGTGSLAAPISQSWSRGVEGVVAGDFNNDGRDDLLIIDDARRGHPRLSQGNGIFSGVSDFYIDSVDFNNTPQTGDFNRDGKLDLVVSDGVTVKIWRGLGNGTFTLSDSETFAASRITVGDLNADGNLDVIGLGAGLGQTILRGILGNADGTFGESVSQTFSGGTELSISSGDFNSDGFTDVVYLSTSVQGNLAVVLSTGQAPYFGAAVYYPVGGIGVPFFGEANALIAADYNADNKVDIGFTYSRARGVIYNTSSQKPCISINDVAVTEGDSGVANAVFTVTLSAPSTQTVRLSYALGTATAQQQTATIGTDIQNVSGRLEIPAGQQSATISIPVVGDLIDEFDENFTVNLSSAANAAIVDSIGVGTIADNDAAPELTVADVSKLEQFSSQQYVFKINLSAPSGKPISLRYATADGSAVSGRDYFATDFTLNLAPGTTTVDAYVTVLGDNVYEPNENFLLNITTQSDVTLADNQALGVILNDDAVPTVAFSFVSGASEGDTGLAAQNVTIQLSNPTYLPVSVSFITSDNTARAGSDYVAKTGQAMIPAEQTSATFDVQLIGDTINESNESFNINIFNPLNAAIDNPQIQFSIFDDEFVNSDFDRDGKTDFAVFRPSNGTWYTLFSATNSFSGFQYGISEDIPVSGDYSGDGRTDIAVWRPSAGSWFIRVSGRSQNWGMSSDKPVPGDYDNDNFIDVAVYRPSNGTWYIHQSSNGAPKYVQFGTSADLPVPADYDGDGKTDVAVFRPENGTWYILRSSDGNISAFQFGIASDKLVPADYDGDGRADIAVFRDGIWYFLRSADNYRADYFQWGQAGDKPVPGNYDGDHKTDFAVYRAGVWYIYQSSNEVIIAKQFGASDDIPIPFVSNN